MDSWNSIVERALVEAYGELGVLEAIPYLEDRLKLDEPADVVGGAARALASLARRNPELQSTVVERLVPMLSSTQEDVRLSVADAMQGVALGSWRNDIERLLQREESASVRAALEKVLGAQ